LFKKWDFNGKAFKYMQNNNNETAGNKGYSQLIKRLLSNVMNSTFKY